jgi:hypothetical protein
MCSSARICRSSSAWSGLGKESVVEAANLVVDLRRERDEFETLGSCALADEVDLLAGGEALRDLSNVLVNRSADDLAL